MRNMLVIVALFLLGACGGVAVEPASDFGEGVHVLRFKQAVISTAWSRDDELRKAATRLCGGPYEKVGESLGRNPDADLIWYVRCLSSS